MTGFDDLARRAGHDLRSWDDSDMAPPPASEIARRSVRRQRLQRSVAGIAAAVVAAGGVAWWQLPDSGSSVELGPSFDRRETTVPDRATTAPSTTTTPTTTAANPAPPVTQTCTADLVGAGEVVQLTIPAGWHANEAVESPDGSAIRHVAACTRFGPQPVTFYDYEPDWGWASNSVVSLIGSPSGPTTFEGLVTGKEADSGTVSSQRTTIDGRPAARLERIDVLSGSRFVQWLVAVGTAADGYHVLYISAGENELLSYEESVAALDAIAHSLVVTAGP